MYLDYTLGTFVGALTVGVFSNLFNRVANAPASIVAMQGLIVLVRAVKLILVLTLNWSRFCIC